MEDFPINVGDIVSLKTHPFTEKAKDIVIGSYSNMLSPLMSVLEVIKEDSETRLDETGIVNGRFKCKCMWFSNKSQKFEEKWLYDNLIKVIKRYNKLKESSLPPVGHFVTLNTFHYESTKKKSLENFHSSDFNKEVLHFQGNNFYFSPLPSFVSPIMQAIEMKMNNSLDPTHCRKSGLKIREKSNSLVKCL